MTIRWSQEGDHAAVIAQAIFAGTSFKDFFDKDSSGPGPAIGEKYDYHTVKGLRNLKLNWAKLDHKIKVWLSNKPDKDTGKRKLPPCCCCCCCCCDRTN
jgi:hypothetical protein